MDKVMFKKEKPKKKASLKVILFILALGLLSTCFFWQVSVKNALNKQQVIAVYGALLEEREDAIKLTQQEIYQPIQIAQQMDSLAVYFGRATQGLSIGQQETIDIYITLLNEQNEVVLENTLPLSLEQGEGFQQVLTGLSSLAQGNYTLALKSNTPEDLASRTVHLGGDIATNQWAYTQQDGVNKTLDGSIYLMLNSAKTYIRLALPYLTLQLVFWGVVVLIYYMACVFKMSKAKVFTVVISLLCVCYTFLQTPYSTPDEEMHYESAYRVSNVLLQAENAQETQTVWMRPTDAQVGFPNAVKTNIENYTYFYGNLFHFTSDSARHNLVETPAVVPSNIGEWFNYFPAALGITLGRVAHVGGVGTFMIARVFTMLVFLFFFYMAMKRLPFGKNAFFAIACLPMFLQEISSVSYDALILGLVYFTIAEVLNYTYRPKMGTLQQSTSQIKTPEKVFVLICFFWLASFKSGIYALIPAFLLVPYVLQQWRAKNKKQAGMAFGAICLLFISILFFAVLTRGRVTPGIDGTTYNGFPVYRVDNTTLLYSIQSIITHPFEMLKLFYRTFFNIHFLSFLRSAVGNLGWFNLKLNDGLTFLFVFTVIFSAISKQKDTLFPTKSERIWWAVCSLGLLGALTVALLISWTPYLLTNAEGIQGRYMLPFLPIALFTILRNRKIQYQKDYTIFLIFCLLFLSYITLQSYTGITLNRFAFT